MSIRITASTLAAMIADATAAHPDEACGILLGANGTITTAQPAANVAPDRTRHFTIDPAALIAAHRQARGGGPAVIGYYHSHPAGVAAPSRTDAAMAAHDGRVWAIIAGETVTCWRDGPSAFEPLSYTVVAG